MNRMELANEITIYMLKGWLEDRESSDQYETIEAVVTGLLSKVQTFDWDELIDNILADDLGDQVRVNLKKNGKKLAIQAIINTFGKDALTNPKGIAEII